MSSHVAQKIHDASSFLFPGFGSVVLVPYPDSPFLVDGLSASREVIPFQGTSNDNSLYMEINIKNTEFLY
jgi:hypothetical protein